MVDELNICLSGGLSSAQRKELPSIDVIDSPGLTTFTTNSQGLGLEALLVNYASEALQHFYSSSILHTEKDIQLSEELTMPPRYHSYLSQFHIDLHRELACVNMFSGEMGILPFIPTVDDDNYDIRALNSKDFKFQSFLRDGQLTHIHGRVLTWEQHTTPKFIIKHYSSSIAYNLESFALVNSPPGNTDGMIQLLQRSNLNSTCPIFQFMKDSVPLAASNSCKENSVPPNGPQRSLSGRDQMKAIENSRRSAESAKRLALVSQGDTMIPSSISTSSSLSSEKPWWKLTSVEDARAYVTDTISRIGNSRCHYIFCIGSQRANHEENLMAENLRRQIRYLRIPEVRATIISRNEFNSQSIINIVL